MSLTGVKGLRSWGVKGKKKQSKSQTYGVVLGVELVKAVESVPVLKYIKHVFVKYSKLVITEYIGVLTSVYPYSPILFSMSFVW